MTTTGRITNTSELVKREPMAGAMLSTPSGIEASERRGQRELVESELLPVDTGRDGDSAFLRLGFRFEDPEPGDPLFRKATLPAGWKRVGSEHAMWSHLVDERGIRRVAMFYKAAWYDREAFMRLDRVGTSLAQGAIHGEEPITREGLRWDVLTEEERAEFRGECERMRELIASHPTIYGKFEPGLKAVEAAIGVGADA